MTYVCENTSKVMILYLLILPFPLLNGVFSNTSTITVTSIIFVFPCLFSDCVNLNSHVNKLRGTTTKNVPGWNLESVTHGSFLNTINYTSCFINNNWWGWGGLNNQNETSSINTILRGCGVGKLGFGDCSAKYGMKVHLNGNEIGMAAKGEKKAIEFNFNSSCSRNLKDFGNAFPMVEKMHAQF